MTALGVRGVATTAALVALLAAALPSPPVAGSGETLAHKASFHGARGAGAPPAPARPPRTLAARTGHTAFEPTLGVMSDGTLFFQGAHEPALDGLTSTPDVLRSEDRGRSWQRTSPTVAGRDVHFGTADPYLHVDPVTDRVFTVDWVVPANCGELSFSDDGGSSWRTTALDCSGADHQHLFTGPPKLSPAPAYPNVVYYCAQQLPAALCSKSLDGGVSFTPTGSAPFASISDVLDCGRLTGHGVVGPDGTVYVPTACDVPYVAISGDEGATWDVVTVSERKSNGNHETAVGVDGDGTVYYLWMGADRLPYLSVSEDGGRTWRRRGIAPPGVVETSLPALAVAPDGTVAAAYMGSRDAPSDRGDYDGATWSGYITMTEDAGTKRPLFASAAFGNRDDPLARGECGPRRCQAQFDFIDVVLDAEGSAWAAFVDGCHETSCIDQTGSSLVFGEGIVGALLAW